MDSGSVRQALESPPAPLSPQYQLPPFSLPPAQPPAKADRRWESTRTPRPHALREEFDGNQARPPPGVVELHETRCPESRAESCSRRAYQSRPCVLPGERTVLDVPQQSLLIGFSASRKSLRAIAAWPPIFAAPLSSSADSRFSPQPAGSSGQTRSIRLAPRTPAARSAPPPRAYRSPLQSIRKFRRFVFSGCPGGVRA